MIITVMTLAAAHAMTFVHLKLACSSSICLLLELSSLSLNMIRL